VFLCGARADKKDSVRRKLKKLLQSGPYLFQYDIFLPEDLFEELSVGRNRQDLLSLENMLADSVDAVVLILESSGAIAELGCFSSNPGLRRKLVCLVDQKYKRAKGFIQNGPLRLLASRKEGSVLFIDYEEPGASLGLIRTAISKVAGRGTKLKNVASVVQAHHFVLSCIYLLELAGSQVAQDELVQLVRYASEEEESRARTLAVSALTILMRNREIEMTPGRGYRLAPLGSMRFATLSQRGRLGNTVSVKADAMDEMRVDILNWRYRRKRLAVR
jgi:hypothetical protein